MFDDILAKYLDREPPGTDTWNPLKIENELWHRVRLLKVYYWAFSQIGLAPEDIRILDVGCGVGRSTRLLIEFGLLPENITGIDIRPDALETARRLNPAINYELVENLDAWDDVSHFDMILQSAVFSSIPNRELRGQVATVMTEHLNPGGHILWWDSILTNMFPPRERMYPEKLFDGCALIEWMMVPVHPELSEGIRHRIIWPEGLGYLMQKVLGHRATHAAYLFKGGE